MVYSGQVIDGIIVIDGGIKLPEGARVRVEPADPPQAVKPLRSSLADWAEKNAEPWGDRIRSEDPNTFTGRGE